MKRTDSEGRDVTELPGLWSEEDKMTDDTSEDPKCSECGLKVFEECQCGLTLEEFAVQVQPDPIQIALDSLFAWIREDYGDNFEGLVTHDLLRLARAVPDMEIEDVIQNIALDWSK